MISVIVTVYNKELYIKKCIESIEKNTYKDIEIIIVEDCSTDNSIKIIEELILNYNNIKLIKNKINSGAGYSRNIGIKAAKGEWISLIDADDWVDKDYFQTYLDSVEDDVDIIFGECRAIEDSICHIMYKRNSKTYNNMLDILKNLTCLKFQFLNVSLIKRILFNNINYCTSRFIEDTPTAYILIYNSKKIQTIEYCGYNYYQAPNSLMHSNKAILRCLYFYRNMIWVIEYFKTCNKEISEFLYKEINDKFLKLFTLYTSNYNDIKPIYDDIDYIMNYFKVSKEYMNERKEYSIKHSTAKIIKIK